MDQLLKLRIMLLLSLSASIFAFSQIADSYKIKIGKTEVFSLLDGTLEVDAEKLFDTNNPGEPTKILSSNFIQNPVEISINVFLIKNGDQITLVDAGAGELVGSTGGHLLQSLASIGIKPEEVTNILLTHIHADHSGGLTIANKKVFPNAIIRVSKKELDFWLNEKNEKNASVHHMGANPKTFQNARNMLIPYLNSGQVITFDQENSEVLPHIYSYTIGGHTPGHSIYVLKDNGEELFFWGDLIHVAAVQLAKPFMMDHFDVEDEASHLARSNFLREAAQKQFLIAGAHISFPGLGRIKNEGKNYKWYPVPYSISGRHR